MTKEMLAHLKGISLHKAYVFGYAVSFASRLIARALLHDLSKFAPDEAKGFAEITRLLKEVPYGSARYKEALQSACIQTHYNRNRHHPEHHTNGLKDMTLMDVVEMLIDWRASTKRNPHGSMRKSLELNRKRFDGGQPPTSLFRILRNEMGIREAIQEGVPAPPLIHCARCQKELDAHKGEAVYLLGKIYCLDCRGILG